MEAALVGSLGRITLGSTKVTIGRTQDNTLVLSDPRVSSNHAEIRPEGAYFSVVDLGSTNGTFVNEQQVYSNAPRLLQPGDTLRVGDTIFTFEIENVPQPYVGGSTIRAIPPPPPPAFGATPNFAGSTSYGMPDYQGTIPAQPAYTPPRQPASPYAHETQIPTYISSSGQQPSYTPPQQSGQQPPYTPPPVYTPPSQPPPPKPSPVRTIVLAVIALVIILGGIGGFFVIQHNQQVYNTNLTATAQSQANSLATSTAQAIAQQTAQAVATVNAEKHSNYPPFTNVASFDTLTSLTSTWDSSSICQFGSSGYMVSIQQAHTLQYCLNNSGKFGEIAYQATMTVQQGDCGGLVFRYVDTHDFYYMDVCQDGSYDIGDYVNGTENLRYSSTQPSSAIIQGTGKQNVIAITVQGNTVNVFINGHNVDSITSQALTTSFFSQGQVGLLADNLGDPTVVSYTNALVWTAQ